MNLWILIAAWYIAWSIWTLGAFAWDKRAAERGAWRVRERTLHLFELLGGWPGAFLAMRVIRHKNQKSAYWLVTAMIAMAHVVLWAVWAFGIRGNS